MGKGKRKRTGNHAVGIFLRIWEHLEIFPNTKAEYAFQWLWENEEVLKLFVRHIIGVEVEFNKALLCNGYCECKRLHFETFPLDTWVTLDNVFCDRLAKSHLSQFVRKEIEVLHTKRGPALGKYMESRIAHLESNAKYTGGEVYVAPIDKSVRDGLLGYFMGDWKKHGMDLVDPSDLRYCIRIPLSFAILNIEGEITYVYDKSGASPILVAMFIKEAIWRAEEKAYIRSLMSQLIEAHNYIERSSCGVLNGHMVAYGPHFHTWEKMGAKKISFYKHVEAAKKVLKEFVEKFGELVDRQAHSKLVDIILGIFLSYCPEMLRSFFEYSDPYLAADDYDPTALELELAKLGLHGPCAYQLLVTANYVSEYHVDQDATKFTLAYASHPDASTTSHIEFQVSDVALRMEVGDGDSYGFRTDYGHATPYRRPSSNAAYVGCVVVNQGL